MGRVSSAASSAQERRLERLFQEHYATVLAYVRRRAPETLIEDVVAETFLVAWRKIDAIPTNALPWLLSVARRSLSTQLRSARRRSALIEKLELSASQVGALSGEPPDYSVLGAFGRLPEKDQEALALIVWEGLKPREAAVVVGESPGAFRMRFYRAKRRFRRELDVSRRDDSVNQAPRISAPREGIAK